MSYKNANVKDDADVEKMEAPYQKQSQEYAEGIEQTGLKITEKIIVAC